MPRHTIVRVGGHSADFIARQILEGRYASADDVVRAGLRLLEQRERKIEVLRTALIEGERSGVSTPFDVEAFIRRKRRNRGRCPQPAT